MISFKTSTLNHNEGFFLLPLIAVIALSIAILSCSLSAWQIKQVKKEFRKRKLVLETRWELEEQSKNAQLLTFESGSYKSNVCSHNKNFKQNPNEFLFEAECSLEVEMSLSRIISSR